MSLKRNNKKAGKFLAAILIVCIFASFVSFQRWRGETADFYRAKALPEKEWILRCQTEDGLILYGDWEEDSGRQEQTIVPYFSSIAALGLLSGTVSEEQAEGARKYLLWYMEHLNTAEQDSVNGDGTIYDYRAVREDGRIQLESTEEYDSVDSYAALFLLAADAYAEKADPSFLREQSGDVQRVADALLRTIGENGFSYVKEQYPVQYLMDNAEVYAGLRAGARLIEKIAPDSSQAEDLKQAADRMKETFDKYFWNEGAGVYEVGRMEDGDGFSMQPWEEFYPDSVAQLFPACFGLTEADQPQAEQLYDRFCKTWRWEELEHLDSGDSSFYWCVLVYAAAVHGDEQRMHKFLDSYHAALEQEGRSYPLYTGEAGWTALACGYMEEQYRSDFWKSLGAFWKHLDL